MLKRRDNYNYLRWLEQNRLPESQPPKRFPESNSLPKKSPESPPQWPPASRSPTDLNPEPSLWEKSESIKSPPIFWSESSPSKEWSEKSPTNGNKSSDSNPQLFWLCKNPPRLTSFPFSRTPTCAPSTPREWPSWPEISNWPRELEVTDSDLNLMH